VQTDVTVDRHLILPNLPIGPQTVPLGALYQLGGDVKIRLV